jgi:hypothetical protein
VASAPPDYNEITIVGPFKRLANPRTQDAVVMGKILRSGELWGNPPRAGSGVPRVQAYRGGLLERDVGFEFYAFTEPDLRYGPEMQWSPRADGSVTQTTGVAKLKILVTRVTQAIG